MEAKVIKERFLKYWFYIVVLMLTFLSGTLINCNGEETKVKTTTKIIYVDRYDTIFKGKPILNYKYMDRIIQDLNKDTVVNEFSPKDYRYTYKKNDSLADVYIDGWGSIDSLSIVCKGKDKFTETLKETTIYKAPMSLFVSGEYLIPISINPQLKPIYKVNLDLMIRDRFIIGISGGTQDGNLYTGAKVGFKI